MSNYSCIVAKVDSVIAIPNADRIQLGKVLGESVVIAKSVEVGHVGVFFCTGTQLSEEFCKANNLFRDKTKNSNPEKSGFFENNRNVRAQPFLGCKSQGYFAELEALSFAGDISKLKVGDKFEEFNKVGICKKYENERQLRAKANNSTKAVKKNLVPQFKEHIETSQFKYCTHELKKGDLISIQSKRHGTSQRVGYLNVVKQPPKWKEWINKFLPIFETSAYDYVVGTRRVILDSPEKEGFHGSEAYRFLIAEKLKPYLVKGMTLYIEVVGWANGKPIMATHSTKALKDKAFQKKYGDTVTYKYGALEGEAKFHIYRITLTTEDGSCIDYTQPQLVQWCKDRDLDPAYDVVEPFIYDGNEEALRNLVEQLTERPEVLTEDYHDASHVSEGVCIRVDSGGLTPKFYKSKSHAFKIMEGIASEETIDVEDIS